jgi:hypothetical protein
MLKNLIIITVFLLTSCKSIIIYDNKARYYNKKHTLSNLISYNLYCSVNLCKLVFEINYRKNINNINKVLLVSDNKIILMTYDSNKDYFYTYITQVSYSDIKTIHVYYLDKNTKSKSHVINNLQSLNKNIKNIL